MPAKFRDMACAHSGEWRQQYSTRHVCTCGKYDLRCNSANIIVLASKQYQYINQDDPLHWPEPKGSSERERELG